MSYFKQSWQVGAAALLAALTTFGQTARKPSKTKPAKPAAVIPAMDKPAAVSPVDPMLSEWESAVLQELNFIRAEPQKAIGQLESYKKLLRGKELRLPGAPAILTNEGVAAFDDAIAYLKETEPLPPLKISPNVLLAARDHLNDLLATGQTGHLGSDGSYPPNRVQKRGVFTSIVGENISYLISDARFAAFSMLIDDGNPNRGHRNNLFSANFNYLGIASGDSKKWGRVCVVTFTDKTGPALKLQ